MELKDVVKLGDLMELGDKDLSLLRETLTNIIQTRREAQMSIVKAQLTEGDVVKVDHKKLAGIECTVTKVNRKKVKVSCVKGNFTVPMGMLILD